MFRLFLHWGYLPITMPWTFSYVSLGMHGKTFLLREYLGLKFLGHKSCAHFIKNDSFPKFTLFISPPTVYESFMFSTPWATLGIVTLFNASHSDGWVVTFHLGINLHVPDDYWGWAPFYVICPLESLFFEVLIQVTCSIFLLGFWWFSYWFLGLLIFWMRVLDQISFPIAWFVISFSPWHLLKKQSCWF